MNRLIAQLFTNPRKNRVRTAGKTPSSRLHLEPLEDRTLPSVVHLPNAPGSLHAKAVSTSEIELSWSAAKYAVNYEIDYYTGGVWYYVDTVTLKKLNITGLSAGTSYILEVGASNDLGTTYAAPISATTKSIATHYSVSGNWSGYGVLPSNGATVTAVGGTWTEPSFSTSGYESSWVGIDGFDNGTVEQLGTAYANGGYAAWIEFYGDEDAEGDTGPLFYQTNIPVAVYPGDTISASINFVSSNGSTSTFFLQFDDATEGEYWASDETTTYVAPQLGSGEWIAEAPGISGGQSTLANFGQENFSGCWATVGGQTGTINNFTNYAIDMYGAEFGGGGPSYTSSLVNTYSSGYGQSNRGSSSFTVFYGNADDFGPNVTLAPAVKGAVARRCSEFEDERRHSRDH